MQLKEKMIKLVMHDTSFWSGNGDYNGRLTTYTRGEKELRTEIVRQDVYLSN